MRIGQEAYTSPAGDLMAFALAVGIVLAAVSAMDLEDTGSDNSLEITSSDLATISNWKGWDKDRDGMLELSSILEIKNNVSDPPNLAIDKSVIVRIESQRITSELLFNRGHLVGRDHFGNVTQGITRSITVLVEDGSNTFAALLMVTPYSGVTL